MWKAKWLVLWSLWGAGLILQPSPTLRLRQGLLRGRISSDSTHYQYLSIPYATSNRFQAPGPPPSWKGVFNAVQQHVRCPQLFSPGVVVGREDCLVVNIYSPLHADPQAPLPVMVFIHGGGFFEGSGSQLIYGPNYLTARGVLLVTFNYRLGVLGFLCLGLKEASGNAGLQDQVAALRWIKNNIRAFGGDPDNITLFGESAGAASVSYHLASAKSRGLFHRAIVQSGSSTAPWARQLNPLQTATKLAEALGYRENHPETLYSIFKNESVSNLIKAQLPRSDGQLKFAHLPFVPCVESESVTDPFITDAPFNIIARGAHHRVPVIIGANNQEGYFFAAFEDDFSLENIKFNAVLPQDLNFTSSTERDSVSRELEELYMGDDEVSWATLVKLSKLHGDIYFTYPAIAETELLLNNNEEPVYSYLFEYDGWRNFPKLISGLRFWLSAGATHADELLYLFSLFPTPHLFESHMIDLMTGLWTNFAKYGEPGEASGVVWPPLTRLRPQLTLRLNSQPRLEPLDSFRPRHMQFWRGLYQTHRASRPS